MFWIKSTFLTLLWGELSIFCAFLFFAKERENKSPENSSEDSKNLTTKWY